MTLRRGRRSPAPVSGLASCRRGTRSLSKVELDKNEPGPLAGPPVRLRTAYNPPFCAFAIESPPFMSALSNPSEIARETLRQLALRRVAPTPDNYRQLYHEIARTAPETDVPVVFLRRIAARLARDSAERQRLARELDQALASGAARPATDALERYLDTLKAGEAPAWNELIANLLRQWEGRQLGWTMARKREALERVLGACDPSTLYTRLQGLLRGWGQAPINPELPAPGAPLSAPTASADAQTGEALASATVTAHGGDALALVEGLRTLLLQALRDVIPAFLGGHPDLADDAALLAAGLDHALEPDTLDSIGAQLRRFTHRLEMTAADDAEIRDGLLELLRLLLRNIDELVFDDKWFSGQIEVLRAILVSPPNPRLLDDAGRRLKELIYKQSQLKHNLAETQRELRAMLAGFVDHLARFAESTGTYHDRIGSCAQRIARAADIGEIGPLLAEVMSETRGMQDETRRSRAELTAARAQVQAAQARIEQLQGELDEASRQMRHDQLTGALNRRGLDDMFRAEAARARRRGSALAVGLLDIDNFKKINDTYGHKVGDDALVHLAGVIRRQLRPQDVVARLGGEEFVILLPETEHNDAYQTLVRLQRELTRNFFMTDQQKVVITFSAGLTPLIEGEDLESTLKRADAAMYEAKQAGRNRVVVAALPH